MCSEPDTESLTPAERDAEDALRDEVARLNYDLTNQEDYLQRCMKILHSMTLQPLRLVIEGVDFEPTADEMAPCIRRRAMGLQHRISALKGQIAEVKAKLPGEANG